MDKSVKKMKIEINYIIVLVLVGIGLFIMIDGFFRARKVEKEFEGFRQESLGKMRILLEFLGVETYYSGEYKLDLSRDSILRALADELGFTIYKCKPEKDKLILIKKDDS